jgi:tRNA (Thr-GGU) A37 N-methylase
MVRRDEMRAGEQAVALPPATDAGIIFIGRIRTPWTDRLACPRQGRLDGPTCRLELFEPFVAALDGIGAFEHLEVLYGCTGRAATSSARARRTTASRAARSRCARRCAPTPSARSW